MAAALDGAQQEFVTGEINRRLAIFNTATTASLQGAVEEARASVARQFEIEKRELSLASEAMEARIMGTVEVAIDQRSNVLVEQFVAENVATRANVDELKVVMEAIGGDKFEAMASKMAAIDQTLVDRTSRSERTRTS